MGAFKKLFGIKDIEQKTPAPEAPTTPEATDQLNAEANGTTKKRKAHGKKDLQIPTAGLNTSNTRGNGVNV
nr:MAG TPA: hypothetical protein [Caudoviricetes sp.]